MTQAIITVPPLPAPLSLQRLHSPSERRAHREKQEAHYAAKRSLQAQEEQTRQTEEAERRRPLSENDYYQENLKRFNDRQAAALERQAAELREKQEHDEALADTSADTVTVSSTTPVGFLLDFQARVTQGYLLDDWSVNFLSGYFDATLKKPALKVASKKGATSV